MLREVTLLPQPDSPTIPGFHPFQSELTRSTARAIPSGVWETDG